MVLHEIINRRRNAPEATDTDHRETYQLLNPDLTKQLGQMGELETAFFLFREGLPLVPVHHVNRLSAPNTMASTLLTRVSHSLDLDNEDMPPLTAFNYDYVMYCFIFSIGLVSWF